ncbi:hypothetical protein GMA19_01541 [Paenibacillus polymyxa E681]|jgi:hypothetical protein|nr:hypothetical protein [Paenibacillus sp. PvR133]QNV56380.1 hypothetical protein GE561_01541 [Paenibacillus polymyxa E681]QNV61217.1 hypothetical protein GMA19_01541 [Paenibacillus polymyxa E681]
MKKALCMMAVALFLLGSVSNIGALIAPNNHGMNSFQLDNHGMNS